MNLTQKQQEKAQSIIKELDLKEIFINDKGEFFTTENLAKLSVKGNSKKIECVKKTAVKTDKKAKDEKTKSEAKAKDVQDLLVQKNELLEELNKNLEAAKPDEKDSIQGSISKTAADIAQLEGKLKTLKGE